VISASGVAVAPEPLATDVALEVFADRGNAVDAAVAAAFAQGVVNPMMCGIGGHGAMVVHVRKPATTIVIDFGEVAGSGTNPRMWFEDFLGQARPAGRYLVRGNVNAVGYRAIAVPGFVRGVHAAWERFGNLPWPRLLEPAVRIAAEGFRVYPYIDRFWRRVTRPPYIDGLTTLTATPASAAVYTRDGTLYGVGDLLVQSDLSRTLREIADFGPDAFYTGRIARVIADDLARNGGLVTQEDLVTYRARFSDPLVSTYRGYRIATEPPPGSGLQLLEMLALLEGFDLTRLGWNSPDYVQLLSEVMKIGFADKVRYIGDPEFCTVPVEKLLSPDYHAGHRVRLRRGERTSVPLVPGTAPDAISIHGPQDTGAAGGTTHLSVMDRHGNAVSLTHSICSSSGVVTPGLGFLYNNCMDQYCPDPDATPNPLMAGRRRATGSCATIVLKGLDPFMILGSSGGNNIPTSVLQTIVNVIDFNMNMQEAVHAPRFHCEGGRIDVEARMPGVIGPRLTAMGYEVVRSADSFGDGFGCVQAIGVNPQDWRRCAGADPRGGGGVAYWP
jgi:gamma-glutamyltranspeptidase/glutathione hydrolase